jgi:putative colanic acid biosynthesis UDP-glucose lipid carrier transferase
MTGSYGRKQRGVFGRGALMFRSPRNSSGSDVRETLSLIPQHLGLGFTGATSAVDAASLELPPHRASIPHPRAGRYPDLTAGLSFHNDMIAPIESRRRLNVKRVMDLVLAVLLLIMVAPALISIAIAIRIESPGSVIFRQKRLGLGNREFVIYKFRSMHIHHGCDPDLPQAIRGDSRISRVGRFLRSTSLDELPQLFNVLLGDMSLVGPRPHAVPHHHKYMQLIDNYTERHRVLPGITGWAQVHGFRGETETLEKMQRRVEYDLMYIENWSFGLDLKILLRTLRLVFSDHNAF